ncbi:MAG: hypothetical protein ACE5KE_10055 [Methanosarcinales archaeon]
MEKIDLTNSWIIKLLFTIRRLPKQARNLKEFVNSGFILLEEKENEEMVFGLVSQPWKYNVVFQKVTPDEFRIFAQKGYVKIVWNFYLSKIDENRTHISTETRIYCTDKKAKLKFSLYWLLISQFSGLIRKIMLKLIKREAEELLQNASSRINHT